VRRETKVWLAVAAVGIALLAWRAAATGMGSGYVASVDGTERAATAADAAAGLAEFSLARTAGIWTAAVFTLAIFSFLYRDNALYRFAEAIVVGVSAAYWMVVGLWTVLVPNLLAPLMPAEVQAWAMPGLSPERAPGWWMYLVPVALGGMLLLRLSPKGAWIARWPLAFIIGTTAGLRLVAFTHADFLGQIRSGILPLFVAESDGILFWRSVQNAVVLLGTLAVLVYFFFSVEHTGAVGKASRVGIWVLMVTFGAAFGYTVMGRIALLAARMEFLFDDWLWLIDPAGRRLGA
jgi:hypothetical protein